MALAAVKKEPAKPKQPEAAPAAEGAAPPPAAKKGKAMLFIGLAVAVLGAGGGGAWWYMHREPANPEKQHKVEPAKPPVFAPLDTFTVNLQQEETAQFAQIGLTLRMVDEAAVNELKLRMPEVRDRILLMISGKKPAQLLSVEGKRKLAEEIRGAVNAILAPDAMLKIAAAKAAERAAAAKAAERAAAAAAKRKPAESAEGQEGDQHGESAEAAEAAVEVAPRTTHIVLPVTGVLFTSFIVQ